MMKRWNALIFLLSCAAGLLTPQCLAQTVPLREEFRQLIEQLQKVPDDNALREKIIKLAGSIKPAPAVPEEARRHFVKAVTLQKDAKSPTDYGLAISEYQQALLVAPWWSDAYYNLSVAFEASGQLNDAMRALKLYLMTNPGQADARTAQDKLYALEAKQEEVAKERAEKDAAAREEEEKYGWLLGRWTDDWTLGQIKHVYRGTVEFVKSGSTIEMKDIESEDVQANMTPGNGYVALRATIDGAGNLKWENAPAICGVNGLEIATWRPARVSISADHRQITWQRPLVEIGGSGCQLDAEFSPHTLTR